MRKRGIQLCLRCRRRNQPAHALCTTYHVRNFKSSCVRNNKITILQLHIKDHFWLFSQSENCLAMMFIDFLVRGLIENALCRQISSAANLLRKHCIKRTFYIPVFYTDVQSVREVSTHLTPSAVTFVLLRSKLYNLGIPEFFNSTIDSSLTPLLEEMSKISKLWCHWN